MFPLAGIIAFLIFVAMGAFAVLVFLIALIVKYLGKNNHWFKKLAMMAAVFFVTGGCGFILSMYYDGTSTARSMDDLICWIFLGFATLLSVIVLLKRKPKS